MLKFLEPYTYLLADQRVILASIISNIILIVFLILCWYLKFKSSSSSPKTKSSPSTTSKSSSSPTHFSSPGWNVERDFSYLKLIIKKLAERKLKYLLVTYYNKFGFNRPAAIKDEIIEEASIEVTNHVLSYMGDKYKALLYNYLGNEASLIAYITEEVYHEILGKCLNYNKNILTKTPSDSIENVDKLLNQTSESINASTSKQTTTKK